MNRSSKNGVVVGLLGAMILSVTAVAAAGDRGSAGSAQAPGGKPQFKVGDVLAVAAENANLMVGSEVLAVLPKAAQILVVETRDGWVGGYVSVGGQQRAGWIRVADFVPAPRPAQPESHLYTAAMQIESQPAQSTTRYQAPVRVSAPSYDQDYHIGYYIRHETDPNVHVWEPWRYSSR